MEALNCYLPSAILSQIHSSNSETKCPFRQSYSTCVLFADVSGYTALCERCSAKGPGGDEFLARHLKSYFEQLVKTVSSQGGDVFKYAGDALIVLWPPTEESDLQTMARRGTQCALEIKARLNDVHLEGDLTFNIKIGVGVGEIGILHVGGVKERREYLPTGHPLVQAFAAEHHATKKEVVLSPETWKLVSDFFEAEKVEDGYAFLKRTKEKKGLRASRLNFAKYKGKIQRVRQYVPNAVVPYLMFGDEKWASELRRVTVLFVNLGFSEDSLSSSTDEALNTVQEVLTAVQSALYCFEGSLNKFLMDDKGSTLIGVFGLPPVAHEFDAVRAVRSAVRIRQQLEALDLRPHIGISTGMAFCGVVGNYGRREYTVLGDTVNLSARLMQHATKTGRGILVDGWTQRAAKHQILFSASEEISVKGKQIKIKIFEPNTKHFLIHRIAPREVGSEFAMNAQNFKAPPKFSILQKIRSEKPLPWGKMGQSFKKEEKSLLTQGIAHLNRPPNGPRGYLEDISALGDFSDQKSNSIAENLRSEEFRQIAKHTSKTDSETEQISQEHVHVFFPNSEKILSLVPSDDCCIVQHLIREILSKAKTSINLNLPSENTDYLLVLEINQKSVVLPNIMDLAKVHLLEGRKLTQNKELILSLVINEELKENDDQIEYYTQYLQRKMDTLQTTNYGGTVLIEGYMGFGKSHLLSNVLRYPSATVLTSCGDAFDYTRPFNVWRSIFLQLFRKEIDRLKAASSGEYDSQATSGQANVANRKHLILSKLKLRSGIGGRGMDYLAPVLNDVFCDPELFEENATTKALMENKSERLKHAEHLLVALIGCIIGKKPYVVAIDDGMYLDQHSWCLCRAIAKDYPNILIIIALRPLNMLNRGAFQRLNFEEYNGLKEDLRTSVIQLGPCTKDQSRSIIYQFLNAGPNDIPEELYEVITEKANGNPLFIKELIARLQQKHCILLENNDPNDKDMPRIIWDPSPLYEAAEKYHNVTDFSSSGQMKHISRGTAGRRSSIRLSASAMISDLEQIARRNIIPVPPAVQSFYSSILDRLTLVQAMVLKTAGFFNNFFTYDMIHKVLPLKSIDKHRTSLEEELYKLVRLKVLNIRLPQAVNDFEICYSFVNTFFRDVAQSRLLSDQKKSMYADINKKKILERDYISDLKAMMPGNIKSGEKSLNGPVKLFESPLLLPESKVWDKNAVVMTNEGKTGYNLEAKIVCYPLYFVLYQKAIYVWSSNPDQPLKTNNSISKKIPYLIIFFKDAEVTDSKTLDAEELCKYNESSLIDKNDSKEFQSKDSDNDVTFEPHKFTISAKCWTRMGNYHSVPHDFTLCVSSASKANMWIGAIKTGVDFTMQIVQEQKLEKVEYREMKKSITYNDNEKQRLAKKFLQDFGNAKIILQNQMSTQRQYTGLGISFKKKYIMLYDIALTFSKAKNQTPTHIISLNLGNCSVIADCGDDATKVWRLVVECDLWYKKGEKMWERHSFIIGCNNETEQQNWRFEIEKIIKKHRLMRARSSSIVTDLSQKVQILRKKSLERKSIMILGGGLGINFGDEGDSSPSKSSRASKSISKLEAVDENIENMENIEQKTLNEKNPVNIGGTGRVGFEMVRSISHIHNSSNILSEIDQIIDRLDSDKKPSSEDLKALFFKVRLRIVTLSERKKSVANFPQMIENCDVDSRTKAWLTSVYTKEHDRTSRKLTSLSTVELAIKSDGTDQDPSYFNIDRWDWNIFQVENENALLKIPERIFITMNLFEIFKIDRQVFQNFCLEIKKGYYANPYHNIRHAIDTMQTVFVLLTTFTCGKFLAPLEQMALLIAALCHDIRHPGLNNEYQRKAETSLAMLYSDQSVLERHHSACTLKILKEEENCNIFCNLSKNDYKIVKNLITEAILATDMTCHFQLIEDFNKMVNKQLRTLSVNRKRNNRTASQIILCSPPNLAPAPPFGKLKPQTPKFASQRHIQGRSHANLKKGQKSLMLANLFMANAKSRSILINVVLHSCDISNPAKPWEMAKRWHDSILQEFFEQGDKERHASLPISPGGDRDMDQPQFALNFIDFIVAPIWVALRPILPLVRTCTANLGANRHKWRKLCQQNIEISTKLSEEEKKRELTKWNIRSDTFLEILLKESRIDSEKKKHSGSLTAHNSDIMDMLQRYAEANKKPQKLRPSNIQSSHHPRLSHPTSKSNIR